MDLFDKTKHVDKIIFMKESELNPYFRPLSSRATGVVMMEGKKRYMLGSNNYLDLTSHPDVMKASINAIEKYGTSCSGSRFLNGTLEMHLELERELAEFLHKEAALVFPTGFQTNLGIISALVGTNDVVILDNENHASIYDGARLSYGEIMRYEHSDMKDLERQLQKVPDGFGALIVTDGVFSMSGEICNLPEICALSKKYGARVMVDDAHGLGVLGVGGRGTPSHFNLEDQVDIYMGTFSKSLASLGGYMAAPKEVIDYVMYESRPYMFSASMPPQSVAAALAALRVLKTNPELPQKLSRVASYVRKCLRERDIEIVNSATPIIPVLTYDTLNTLTKSKEAYEAGVYVNPVLPPACKEGEGRLRISCIASLTNEQIEDACDILADVLLD